MSKYSIVHEKKNKIKIIVFETFVGNNAYLFIVHAYVCCASTLSRSVPTEETLRTCRDLLPGQKSGGPNSKAKRIVLSTALSTPPLPNRRLKELKDLSRDRGTDYKPLYTTKACQVPACFLIRAILNGSSD